MKASIEAENSLLSRIASISGAIRDRAGAAEQLRRIPDESIRELVSAGLFRAFVPRRHGGDEMSLRPVFEAGIALGKECASTAWVGTLCAAHSLITAWYDDAAQAEVWANGPDAIIASSFPPMGRTVPVEGGYRLTGRWQFSSGVDHSSWVLLGATIPPAAKGPLAAAILLVPTSECTIHDDWFVAGLRATGSKSLEVKDVLVPHHRCESMAAFTKGTAKGMTSSSAPVYKTPWQALFPYLFTPPAIGNATAMIGAFRTAIASRRSAYTREAYRDKPASLLRLASSAAEVNAARLLLERDLDLLERATEAGAVPESLLHRTAFDPAAIIDLCRRSVTRLFVASGGGALYDHNPIQRHFRDMHAITQHPAINIDALGESYGKALVDDPSIAVDGTPDR